MRLRETNLRTRPLLLTVFLSLLLHTLTCHNVRLFSFSFLLPAFKDPKYFSLPLVISFPFLLSPSPFFGECEVRVCDGFCVFAVIHS